MVLRHPKQQGLRLYQSVMQSMPLHSRIHPPYQNLQAGALEQGNLPLIAAQTSVQANVTFWPGGKRLRPTRRGPSVSPRQGSCMPLAASPLRAALDGRLVPGPCCPASGPGVGGRYWFKDYPFAVSYRIVRNRSRYLQHTRRSQR